MPHRQWLAAQVLSDQQTVSYRTLARALKVHVNAAKRMLYDFHSLENAKKPGSVHATYLLAGVKKAQKKAPFTNGQNRPQQEDEPVGSSPPPFTSSMLHSSQQTSDRSDEEITSIRTITLVREESLDAVKSSYESITSIHIYSLSAGRLQDMQTLSDTGRHLYDTYFVKEDPLEQNATYGVILNKNVKRRTVRRPPPLSTESKPVIKSSTSSITTSKLAEKTAAASQPSIKKEETSRPSSAGSTTSTTSKKTSLKRDTSDIFKSFAKARTSTAKPTPKLSRNETDSSVGNTSDDQDTKLPNASEDEGESEEEALFLDTNTRAPARKRAGTCKAEREAKLRKMMNDSDAEMEDAELTDPAQAGLGTGDQANKDGKSEEAALRQGVGQEDDGDAGEGVNWSDSDTERQAKKKEKAKVKAEAEAEAEHKHDTSAPPKRRRGKRRVVKKKTTKDEEGYLVTREEPAWESFSEDEPVVPAQPKTRPAASTAQAQAQTSSQGKSGAKGATAEKGRQKAGNIMSFFGKR